MTVYAFDVDETLELSGGPVRTQDLWLLRAAGHVVGICGNWAVFCNHPMWSQLVSFIGPAHGGATKADFLRQLKTYIPADDYVMVGNDHGRGVYSSPDDASAAGEANWRFISETDFAAGAR